MTFTHDPLITRFSPPGERFAGFMAVKIGKDKELVVAEYSEAAQEALKAELARRDEQRLEIEALKKRPEVIEGDFAK